MTDVDKAYDRIKKARGFMVLLPKRAADIVAEDWVRRMMPFDITFRRAKTEGCIVVQLTDMRYAVQLYDVWKDKGAQFHLID